MNVPKKIKKLDDVVVNRIAAGEVIQRPGNALKELIENSLDAKATNIQIIVKEGGLKLLQIQDNGTGIRKEDMDIVCERFTTSKLQTFEDLQAISTFGFRGEALASISHVSLLTITSKTLDEKCAYKASYVDSKLKGPVKLCAGNQGTTILIENLFYNVATRRKALSNPSEEFNKIADVVTKYAIHNPNVGFVLKKHGEISPQMNNIRILYGNPVFRELLEVEHNDDTFKFKMHALITNPNYTSKRMTLLLFINNRLVESSSIRKMLEEIYSFYLPKKAHPWCYVSLEIEPRNVDVNVHPTKHEVKFLHEDSILERMKLSLDEKLSGSSGSRTFYVQARLPKADITKDVLKEVLPEYEGEQRNNIDKVKKIRPQEMIRTSASDQKLDRFNFTVRTATKDARSNDRSENSGVTEGSNDNKLDEDQVDVNVRDSVGKDKREADIIERSASDVNSTKKQIDTSTPVKAIETKNKSNSAWSNIVNDTSASTSGLPDITNDIVDENATDESVKETRIDVIADKARKQVYKLFGSGKTIPEEGKAKNAELEDGNNHKPDEIESNDAKEANEIKRVHNFKSYSINNFRREVKLTSVLRLRVEAEEECHEGLTHILSGLIFVGCIDQSSALIQSGVNLYLCDTKKLAEELFYQIMLYDFANYGVIKFSNPIPLYDIAMLGLGTEEAGWTEEDGPKEELATNVKELLLEKADMLKEYFSLVIDKAGNLKSLPALLEKYYPCEAGLPLYVLRLATEVQWSTEQPCFRSICRETAKYYSQMSTVHGAHDWKYITEHVLYSAIKESLLPSKYFAHDSTILQIANLPDLYKVFERC
ncbi:DNA mismatch repair ATPase Mlh1 isoform X2 [Xylocopa sonorina]|uniref:DNA mismatch repair ATPase Mlh1 isoform X2 n=1 Tax=Xylocopa sonorina TaxID=1818115 RepID=UPI00403A9D7A